MHPDVGIGLEYLHSLSIIHRDMKPDNLLLCSNPYGGRPILKITDFGLARTLEGSSFSLSLPTMFIITFVQTKNLPIPWLERRITSRLKLMKDIMMRKSIYGPYCSLGFEHTSHSCWFINIIYNIFYRRYQALDFGSL